MSNLTVSPLVLVSALSSVYSLFPAGSSDLWVPSSSCKECGEKKRFNAISSDTAREITTANRYQTCYAGGLTVSGPVYTDTGQPPFFFKSLTYPTENRAIVTVAGITVNKQYFSPITTVSTSGNNAYTKKPIDGILGLGLLANSVLGQPSFFANVLKEGKANSFAIHVASTGLELYIGGGDRHLYEGEIEEHAIDNSMGRWQVKGASVLIGDTVVVSGFDTIIDSGSTMMYAPYDKVRPASLSMPFYCLSHMLFLPGGADLLQNPWCQTLGDHGCGHGRKRVLLLPMRFHPRDIVQLGRLRVAS